MKPKEIKTKNIKKILTIVTDAGKSMQTGSIARKAHLSSYVTYKHLNYLYALKLIRRNPDKERIKMHKWSV